MGESFCPTSPDRRRGGNDVRTTSRTAAAPLAAVTTSRQRHPHASAIVRRHLEWPARRRAPPPGLARLATKGGSFPGVIAEASYTAADDGTTRITVLIMRRLPEADWISPAQSRTQQQVIVPMGIDPAFVTRVAGALAG